MKKTISLLYGFLILFTVIGLLIGNSTTESLRDLFQGEADPFTWMLFMLLGIYPLAFLLFAYKHYRLKWYQTLLLISGFFFGGYTLTHAFYNKQIKKSTGKWINLIALGLIIFTIILLGHGFILGNVNVYLSSIEYDNFVYVMTLDFIFQWALSICLSRRTYAQSKIAFIPLIGFLFLIFNED